MRYFPITIFILLVSCVTLFGQYPNAAKSSITGKITGKLVDTSTQQPVEFASVVLVRQPGGEQVDGGLSNEEGYFKFSEVKLGTYDLSVTFLGYKPKVVKGIELTPSTPDVNIDAVYVSPEGINLDAVEVVGEAALIENKIDRLVFNAEKDVATSGGDATDLLRRVPMVSVDLEGNVSLRGSSNVRILINGRPSNIVDSDPTAALQSISADDIKSIEVITVPSARYEGEGSAGMINIITKKKGLEGVTGSVRAGIGTRNNNGNASFNYAKGRFGFNSSAGFRGGWPRTSTTSFYREVGPENNKLITQQDGTSEGYFRSFNGGIGIFYDLNAYNSFTSNASLRGVDRKSDALIMGSTIIPGADDQMFDRDSDSKGLSTGFDWTTDYRRTFPTKDQELVLAFQLSGNVSTQDITLIQMGTQDFLSRNELNNNDGLNLEKTLQLDYVQPVGNKLKIETGAKAIFRDIDSDYDFNIYDYDTDAYELDQSASDEFNYQQDVFAGYVQTNLQLAENWTLLTGLRYEHTAIEGDYLTEKPSFEDDYDNFLPTIILSRQLGRASSAKLSYTKRLQRPSLRYINPFTDNSDPNNITLGNPGLSPELTDQFELSYNTFVKGVSINASLYYRQTNDVIERFTETQLIDEVLVTINDYRNIGEYESLGLNLFSNARIMNKLTLRGGFDIYTYDAQATNLGRDLSRQTVLWNSNLSLTWELPRDIKVEGFGFFRSRRQTLQGVRPNFWMYSIGARKEFAGGRSSLGIQIIEPFNTNKNFYSELQDENFYQRSNFSVPFQSFNLTFSYRFGKLDSRQRVRSSRIKNTDQKASDENNI